MQHLWLIIVIGLPFTFWSLGSITFLDPDEGLYATMAQEMSRSGDWLFPRFNGILYLEKPPLYPWLAGLTMWLLQPSEWTARLWSALPGLFTVLLTWRLGRLLYNPGAGLYAALVLVSSAGYVLFIRKLSTDFLTIFAITLAIFGFVRDVVSPERGARRFLWLYVGSGLGVLAKGLIGMVLPLSIVGLSVVVVGRLALRELNLWRGLGVFLAIVLPWHVVMGWYEPELLWFYLVDNQILRFFNLRGYSDDDVSISTVGLLVVTLIWFFPWSVLLPASFRRANVGKNPWWAVAPIWILVVVGFFSLARFKHEYYALPALPALAVLVGGAWQAGRGVGRWLWVGALGAVPACWWLFVTGDKMTPGLALHLLGRLNAYYRILLEQGLPAPFASVEPLALMLRVLGVSLVVGWGVAALTWTVGWRRTAFSSLLIMSAVVGLLVVQLLRFVEPHHSTKAVADALLHHSQEHDAIVHEGSLLYSAGLPFYTKRQIIVLGSQERRMGDEVAKWRLGANEADTRDWFLDEAGLEKLWHGPQRVFFVTQWSLDESLLGKLPRQTVYKIGQYGSRGLYSNR